MLYIFDLDHTVIDSSHRQITLADGSLDLDAWIENSTRKKIFQDRMLPLADIMRNLIADKSHKVAICTARNLSKHDYDFIRERGLFCDHILARQNGDNRPDDELKYSKIWNLLTSLKIPRARWRSSVCLLDDNQSVLTMADKKLKITTINAIDLNRKLKNA